MTKTIQKSAFSHISCSARDNHPWMIKQPACILSHVHVSFRQPNTPAAAPRVWSTPTVWPAASRPALASASPTRPARWPSARWTAAAVPRRPTWTRRAAVCPPRSAPATRGTWWSTPDRRSGNREPRGERALPVRPQTNRSFPNRFFIRIERDHSGEQHTLTFDLVSDLASVLCWSGSSTCKDGVQHCFGKATCEYTNITVFCQATAANQSTGNVSAMIRSYINFWWPLSVYGSHGVLQLLGARARRQRVRMPKELLVWGLWLCKWIHGPSADSLYWSRSSAVLQQSCWGSTESWLDRLLEERSIVSCFVMEIFYRRETLSAAHE